MASNVNSFRTGVAILVHYFACSHFGSLFRAPPSSSTSTHPLLFLYKNVFVRRPRPQRPETKTRKKCAKSAHKTQKVAVAKRRFFGEGDILLSLCLYLLQPSYTRCFPPLPPTSPNMFRRTKKLAESWWRLLFWGFAPSLKKRLSEKATDAALLRGTHRRK